MNSLFLYLIWKIGFSKKPVFISGSPRSGTTWVMDVLEKISNSRVHWEPLNWYLYHIEHDRYKINQTGLRPDIKKLESSNEYRHFLAGVLTGKPPLKATMARITRIPVLSNLLRIVLAKNTIIKFVFAQRAIGWIASNTECQGCIIIRHPASIVASQLFHPYLSDMKSTTHPEWTTKVINETHPIFSENDLILFPELKNILNLNLTYVGKLAVTACLDLFHSIESEQAREKFIYIYYESLKDSPEKFRQLATKLGLAINTEPSTEMLRERSRTSSDTHSERPTGLGRLSSDELDEVNKILNMFNIEVFNSDMTLNLKYIESKNFNNFIY